MVAVVAPPARQPGPRLAALIISPLSEHRQAWIASLRRVGIGRVLEAMGPVEALFRGDGAVEHGVCIVEAGAQDRSVFATIRELRRQGWSRLVLVTPRGDGGAVRLALAAKVRSLVLAPPEEHIALTAGDAPPDSRETGADLSEREVQVVQLVADGHTNREIGEELNLSALTVKSHLSRIGRKLGTGDRAQMVAICMRAGLIT
jgi:DNA-binding NarL/FixJ family response regulator